MLDFEHLCHDRPATATSKASSIRPSKNLGQCNAHAALTRAPHRRSSRAGLFLTAPPAKQLPATPQAADGYAKAPAYEATTGPTEGT